MCLRKDRYESGGSIVCFVDFFLRYEKLVSESFERSRVEKENWGCFCDEGIGYLWMIGY